MRCPKRGRSFPRLHVNPTLREAVLACGTPGWILSINAGLAHHSKFSKLINDESVPASPTNIERLERIAELVGFPKARLFMDGAR